MKRVKTGLAFLKHCNDTARLPVLEALDNEYISFFWKEPVQATRESLIRTHQECLLLGQMASNALYYQYLFYLPVSTQSQPQHLISFIQEFAMPSAFHSCRHNFMSGTHLLKLHSDCTSVTNKMASITHTHSEYVRRKYPHLVCVCWHHSMIPGFS